MQYRPLADEIRPQTLEDVVGQSHILGKNGVLRRIIESGQVPNMVFFGPSGTGKTTVANIIANQTHRTLHRLNATTASIADIREVIADVDTLLAPNGVLLYLDEIQYFNKKQQQSLLEFMENGKITVIASTTENPYFTIFNAVLSRSTVFEFKPVTPQEVRPAVDRAFRLLEERSGVTIQASDDVRDYLATACGGDVRKAINGAELLCAAGQQVDGVVTVTLEDAELVGQKSAFRYDRDGDNHYDILSALQKSIRGSDPDAGLHYLARLLEAGDLISPCRRLLVIASEDVGMAYPMCAVIVKACVDSALQLGLPEARIPIAEAVVLLATSPKSNSAYEAINAAMADVEEYGAPDFPRHLQNKHFDGAEASIRGQHYLYPHSYPNHYVRQQYLPDILKDKVYYRFGDNRQEQAAAAYREKILREDKTGGK